MTVFLFRNISIIFLLKKKKIIIKKPLKCLMLLDNCQDDIKELFPYHYQ